MIVQCDQCNTRFKLDDAKVKEEGIKVRCSKCKNIFIVKKESPQEENEFESILGQLGSAASEKDDAREKEASYQAFGDNTAPVADGSEAARGEETPGASPSSAGMVAWPEENFSTTPAVDSEPAISKEQGFDLERFSFEEESSTLQAVSPESARMAEEKDEGFAFGDVSAVPEDGGEVSAEGGEKSSPLPFAFDSFAVDEDDVSKGKASVDEDISFTFDKDIQGTVSAEQEGKPVLPPHDELGPSAAENVVQNKETGIGSAETFDFSSIDFGTVPPDDKISATRKHETSAEGESAHSPQSSDEFFAFSPSADESAPGDELPPLSIASRRKGVTSGPIMVIVIAVVLVLALAAAGLYLFAEGPAGFEKAGLGPVVKWLGFEAKEDGGVSIRNTTGNFVVNKEAGELFVIRGEAVNNFRKPRASIQVKVVLYGPKNQVATQKSAYCGNALSNEQVASLPMVKIEEAMNNQFGDSLSNLGVQPGKGIPFVVVLSSVPKDVTEFGVEVIGSTVASR